MKEKPIIYNGEMVRAILDGRKTQTRRVVKPQPEIVEPSPDGPACGDADNRYLCPYGQPGDRLWVRETWSISNGPGIYVCEDQPHITVGGFHHHVFFRADSSENTAWGMYGEPKWKPSIHMPRTASRITLEITGIRVEQVQDISEADAKREGVITSALSEHDQERFANMRPWPETYRPMFKLLWDSINAKRGYGWDVNPLVWVIEFRRIEP